MGMEEEEEEEGEEEGEGEGRRGRGRGRRRRGRRGGRGGGGGGRGGGEGVYSNCLVQLLVIQGPNSRCPSCHGCIKSDHITKCSDVITELIHTVRVKCKHNCHVLEFSLVVAFHVHKHSLCCQASNFVLSVGDLDWIYYVLGT